MSIFNLSRTIDRLNKMIDRAVAGKPVESSFDESKMSALETKLSHYLTMNSTAKAQLGEEKLRIHELISDISHQTKTPIANILLYAELLEEGSLSDDEKGYLGLLMEQAEKLNFLISSLVKISRLETGVIAAVPRPGPVQTLFDYVQNQAVLKAEEKGIGLFVEETDNIAVFDLKWTTEALYNIVDNAIKYTPEGGKVSVSATAYQLFCRIDVVDTGIGIAEAETAKVFTRFYRSPAVSGTEGVGVGLFLSREIISGQGGYIKVKSVPGKGSAFSIFLPMPSFPEHKGNDGQKG